MSDEEIFDFDPVGEDGMRDGERTFTERGPTPGRDWHGSLTVLNGQRVFEAMREFLTGKKWTFVSYQNNGNPDFFWTPSLRAGEHFDPRDAAEGKAIKAHIRAFPYVSEFSLDKKELSPPNVHIHWHDTYGVGGVSSYAMDAKMAAEQDAKVSYTVPYISFNHSKNGWHGLLSITFRVPAGYLTEWHFVIEPEPFEDLPYVYPHPNQLMAVSTILRDHAARIVEEGKATYCFPKRNARQVELSEQILRKAAELQELIGEAQHEWGPERH